VGNGSQLNSGGSANLFIVIAAVIVVLFFGMVYYRSKGRQGGSEELSAYLMDEHLRPDVSTVMTPATATVAPMSMQSPVWLAPDAPPAQFEPSHIAAVASTSKEWKSSENAGAFLPFCLPADELTEPEQDDHVWLAPVS
jgi:hypothetical protein